MKILLYFPCVIYSILKWYARLAIKIYCRRIIINRAEVLKSKGPLLLAANHPNSFLDGIILTTLFDEPVHSLARGDVFKKQWISKILRRLQLLPVYRTSEGVENLEHNYTTFAACQKTFKENGIVLIFSEGRCENEWHLRALKKGTARLAVTAWENDVSLKVIPTALNYSSFRKFGKEVHLFFGEAITAKDVSEENQGKKFLKFNELLREQLHMMIYEIKADDEETLRKKFNVKVQPSFYFLLLPAIIGWIFHAPLFYLCKVVSQLFKSSGHYDSVLISSLFLLYTVYLLLLFFIAFHFVSWYGLLILLVLPFTAWACVQVKYQMNW